jgi:DNA invertase Pin-like site-specific DNA recombinase
MSSKKLRAAYYARYSTDGQEADSIDRQFMVCASIASREGFIHSERHRFSDPETSGGTPRRAGYLAMLAAVARGEFDVLIAEDISRLWRNMEMQTRDINELLGLRIAIVTQAEDTRRDNDLMMLNLKGSMNEANRKEIGRRVRNKLQLLAKSGRPAGGRPYGYIPAAQSDTGQIEVLDSQAEVVRQIFERRASGWSGRRIAQELNARRIPSPGAAWKRNGSIPDRKRLDGEWVRSAIVGDVRRGIGILNNPIYKGDIVWGRSRWIRSPRDSAIRRCELIDDPQELISYHVERLRIVSDDLWNRVQAVQCARTPRSDAIRAAKRLLGRGPALWLSSLLVCSECGSNYVQYGRRDYVCSGFHNGSTCSNGMRFRIADIEAAVLAALEMDLLSPAALERATDLAMEYFDRLYKVARPASHTSRELLAIAARETEIREQFKAGKLPPAVFKTWLEELAKERRTLSRPAPVPPTPVSRSEFLHAYKAAVARRLRVFTKRDNVASARVALRNVLVDGRLVLRPDAKNARFEGTLTLSHEQFLAEKQVDIKMVAGARFVTNLQA